MEIFQKDILNKLLEHGLHWKCETPGSHWYEEGIAVIWGRSCSFFPLETPSEDYREDGENAEKCAGWQREQQHCQNPIQIQPPLFISKNSLHLRKGVQLNLKFGSWGRAMEATSTKSTQIHLPYLFKRVNVPNYRRKSGQTVGVGTDGNPLKLEEGIGTWVRSISPNPDS